MNHGVIEQVGSPTDIYREPDTLFVADFIGETNKFETIATLGGGKVGSHQFKTRDHQFADGESVMAAIRPEDIIPHGTDGEASHEQSNIPSSENTLETRIDEMEFLGAFWRTRLHNDDLGDEELIADFSINAVRRLDLAVGNMLTVELPAERLMIFPKPDSSNGSH